MGRGRRRKKPRQRGKGIYVLPNLFTTASLFGGFYAIISAINLDFMAAALAIMISGVFDFLDGKVARATKTTSQFGVEYDSLSDLVAFGVAPGILVFIWALEPFASLGWAAAFLFVACGALRLARFNVVVPTKGQDYFQGLPIPGAAAMVCTTVFLFDHFEQTWPVQNWTVLILVFALSFLMVSNFRYFSLKNTDLLKRKPFNTLVAAVLLLSLFAVRPKVFLFIFFLCYVISGPILTIYKIRELRRTRQERPELAAIDADTPQAIEDGEPEAKQ